jgi:hypothetical protein
MYAMQLQFRPLKQVYERHGVDINVDTDIDFGNELILAHDFWDTGPTTCVEQEERALHNVDTGTIQFAQSRISGDSPDIVCFLGILRVRRQDPETATQGGAFKIRVAYVYQLDDGNWKLGTSARCLRFKGQDRAPIVPHPSDRGTNHGLKLSISWETSFRTSTTSHNEDEKKKAGSKTYHCRSDSQN